MMIRCLGLPYTYTSAYTSPPDLSSQTPLYLFQSPKSLTLVFYPSVLCSVPLGHQQPPLFQ